MNVTTIPYAVVAGVGLGLTLGSGYLVVRGPFLGGPAVDGPWLLAALGGFVVGLVVLSWAGTRIAGVGRY